MTLTEFVNRNKGQIKKYKKFIESNDWVVDKLVNLEQPLSCIKTATERFNLQNSIIRGIVDRLKYFVKTYEGQWGKKSYKEFLHLCVDTIDLHLFRAEDYITEFDLSAYKQPKEQEEEIELQNHIFVSTSSIREVLSGINLTDGEDSSEIEFYKDQYAPLIMHEQIVNLYPSIQKKLDDLGIDFNRKPEPTFHILNTNPPVWDTNKNYFDQEPETLQYYIDEWNKIKNGIKVDGVYLTGWTYYQINFFIAKHPSTVVNPISGKEENKDVIGVPPYRDTEWLLIQEEFERATERKEMVFIAASRRVGKTTMEASRLSYAKVIGRKAMLVVSGSKKDIGQLEDAVTIANENIHPAFRSYTIVNDWEVVVEIGVRLKSGKKVVANKMKIVNLDRGTGKKSEDLAGFTPDEAVIDEIMKLPFKTHLEALRPALNSPSGLRCTVILAGTGGNEELSKDAFDMLMEPEKYGFLPMDWDKFNSRVPKEHRTWKERPFGIFVPAQMGAIDGAIKVKMPLSEYLGVKSKTLSKIHIMVTDWESATKAVYDYRGKVSDDIESYTKRVIYYPACPSDMLLSGRINSFPVNEAKMHLEYLKTSGGRGKKVFLYEKDDGSISYSMTENETPKFPHKGGFVDGPVMLYEDLPEEAPPDYLYVAGCLTPGEKVLTQKGLKKVEDVNKNDKLVSKDGKLVEIKSFFKHYKEDEDVYTITVGNTSRPTTFTEEHPIYSFRPEFMNTRPNNIKRFNEDLVDFIKVKDLKVNDWIKYPNNYLSDGKDFTHRWKNDSHKNSRPDILSSRDFWYFIGMFLGDGYVVRKGGSYEISISLNSKEEVSIKNCKRIVEDLFKRSPSLRVRNGSTTISFTDRELGIFITENFGKYAQGKYISEWVKRIDNEYKYEILCGYLNSDGCFMNLPNGYLLSEFVSISLQLLEDVQDIMFSLGIVSSLTVLRGEKYEYFSKDSAKKSRIRETYMLRVNQFGTLQMYENFRKEVSQKHPKILRELKRASKSKGVCFLSEDLKYIYFKVKKIEKKKYTGVVYNFECETNTFLARHITTHNCDDYKQDESDTDSVGSFVIYKRDYLSDDPFSGKVVATIATRPDPHGKFHQQIYLLQRAFNAVCFMENADTGYVTYLQDLRVDSLWLQPAIDFSGDIVTQNNSRRKYGWNPSHKPNRDALDSRLITYTKRKVKKQTTDGEFTTILGVQNIDDVGILEEICAYDGVRNVDRLTAFKSALGLDFYYHVNKLFPDETRQKDQNRVREEDRLRVRKKRSFFGSSNNKRKNFW